MKSTFRLLQALLIAVSIVSRADDCAVPAVRQPLMRSPVIDGRVDAAEWAGAARMEGMGRGPMLAPLDVGFQVGCDGTNLFIAVVSATPPGGKILNRIVPLPDARDARTWMDDSIEIVLDPNPSVPDRRLFHANFNARGAIHDTAYVVAGNAEAWRGAWRTASQILGDAWHFELAIPLKDLGLDACRDGHTMGVRIGRNWQRTAAASQTEWAPRAGAYLNPDTLPQVTWDAAAPVVQVLQVTDAERSGPRIKLAVANPGAAAVPIRVFLRHQPKNSAPHERNETHDVGPGAVLPLELAANALNEEVRTSIRITSADGTKVFYLREYLWSSTRPDPLWKPDDQAVRQVETQFAFYPSSSRIHFKADISGLEQRDRVTGARLDVRRKGATAPLASTNLPAFQEARSAVWWTIAELGEGEYEAVLTLEGVKVDPVMQPFVRHVFPWEKNTLGRSNAIVEPFTPITVRGRRIGTVLRQHALDRLGLWEQVESLDKPLLKGPMRLEVRRGDQVVPIKRGSFSVETRQPERVVTRTRWEDAGLSGVAVGEWDYDGMQKWTLTLDPSPEPVDALTLVVPIDNAMAPLFHACTDGLRFNFAGYTPAGEGRVWESGKAPRNSIIGSYVPYIWLGAEERGLAVFGENDRGWVTATNVPCQEIVRRGDTLELRLNLIARPTVLNAPRRIMIGFQATPVKPLPPRWRQWAVSYATRVPAGGKRISFMGSCWYWGSLTPCLDVYPRDEDFAIWDEFKKTRASGDINQTFIDAWLKGYVVKTPEQFTTFKNHVNAGFHTMRGKPTDVLPYTNARGVRFDTREGQTFLDEWHRDAFTTRVWPVGGGVAYDLNPGDSFRDYAMWYYKKMFETFADHIYWDDIFLQSHFDLIGSEAYLLPDGTVQPASGLFDMRELVRRTAVLQHEMGRPSRANQLHITNTALAPVLAFGGTILTWEDRAGDRDFQDRFSRDYIRAESIGRQFGTVPFALQLIKATDPVKEAWVKRTMTGVMLTHEIRSIGVIPEHEACLKALYEYGYGDEGVAVYNYWEDRLPVVLSRDDAIQLIVTKPGSALVAVCDYGEGGDVAIRADPKRLGIAGKLTATNVETQETLPVTGEGQIQLKLKKHDFALLRIEGEP